MEATTRSLVQSYQDASDANDTSILSRGQAPDCVRSFGPASFLESLGAPADITFDQAMYAKEFGEDLKVSKIAQVETLNLVVDVEARKTVVRAAAQFELRTTGEVIPLEVVLFLDFSDDGTEIVKIFQFVDVSQVTKFRAKARDILGPSTG
jgi:hypothetical protein